MPRVKDSFDQEESDEIRPGVRGSRLEFCDGWRCIGSRRTDGGYGDVPDPRNRSSVVAWRRRNRRRQPGDVLCVRQGKSASAKGGTQVAWVRGCGGCRGCRGCRAAVVAAAVGAAVDAAAAALHGAPAACAEARPFSNHSDIRRSLLAGFDNVDPANPCPVAYAGPFVHGGRPAHDRRIGLSLVKKSPRPTCDEKSPSVGDPRRKPAKSGGEQTSARALLRRRTARKTAVARQTFRNSRRILPSMCCRPTRCACTPKTGNSSSAASYIARSPPLSGKAARAFAELARQLSKNFPPDKIEQALKGLMERHYIVPASSPRRCRRLLGEPGLAARFRRAEPRELPRAGRGDRRQGAAEFSCRVERTRRPPRQPFTRPDSHAGK